MNTINAIPVHIAKKYRLQHPVSEANLLAALITLDARVTRLEGELADAYFALGRLSANAGYAFSVPDADPPAGLPPNCEDGK